MRVIRTVVEKAERGPVDPAVSAAASALSKFAASKGGNSRREALSPTRRAEIAKRAAAARWQSEVRPDSR